MSEAGRRKSEVGKKEKIGRRGEWENKNSETP